MQYIPSLLFFQMDLVARLLMVVNASVNFLVYCAGSTAFQVTFSICFNLVVHWDQSRKTEGFRVVATGFNVVLERIALSLLLYSTS